MQKKARCIDVATIDGKVILSLYLYEREVTEDNPAASKDEKKADPEKAKDNGNNSKNNDLLMTPAQKRYLFRILADQGIEGDKAHEHLKKTFQVDALTEVTKLEASKMIEQLLGNNKGG